MAGESRSFFGKSDKNVNHLRRHIYKYDNNVFLAGGPGGA
jgi:hypothetical protein